MSQGIGAAFGWQLEPTPWSTQAACSGADAELFFPDRGQSARQARNICTGCPVRAECLDYALRWHIAYGVWGGLSYRQRRHLLPYPYPPRVPAPHGSEARYHAGCHCLECTNIHRQIGAEYKRRQRQRDLWDDEPIDGRAVQTIQVRRAL